MYVHKQYLLEFIMQNGQIMIFLIYDLFNTVIAIRKFMKMCEIMHIIVGRAKRGQQCTLADFGYFVLKKRATFFVHLKSFAIIFVQ